MKTIRACQCARMSVPGSACGPTVVSPWTIVAHGATVPYEVQKSSDFSLFCSKLNLGPTSIKEFGFLPMEAKF